MGLIKKGRLIEKGVLYLEEQVSPSPRIETSMTELHEIELPETFRAEELGMGKEELVDYAKSEAEQIVRKAMEEAGNIREHAKESGLEEARRIAEETASDKVKRLLRR